MTRPLKLENAVEHENYASCLLPKNMLANLSEKNTCCPHYVQILSLTHVHIACDCVVNHNLFENRVYTFVWVFGCDMVVSVVGFTAGANY